MSGRYNFDNDGIKTKFNSKFLARDRSSIEDNWRVKREPVKEQSSLKNEIPVVNDVNIDNIVNNINSVNTTIKMEEEVHVKKLNPLSKSYTPPGGNTFNQMNGLGPTHGLSTVYPQQPYGYQYQYPNHYPNQYMMQYNQYPNMNPNSYYGSTQNMLTQSMYQQQSTTNQPNLMTQSMYNQQNVLNQHTVFNLKSEFLVPVHEERKKDKPSKYGVIDIASFKKDYPRFFDEVLFRYLCDEDYDIIDSSLNK